MIKLLKWFWADKVSLVLWILILEFVIGHFVTGSDYTPVLAIFLLYIVFMVRERGIYLTKVNEAVKGPVERAYLKLPNHDYQKPLPTLFGTLVNVLLLVGSVAILVIVGLRLSGVIGGQ